MAEKMLIVAPAWVGDMVMAQSLFKFLRQTRPHCVIDVLAPSSTLPLLSRMAEVRRAMLAPFAHGELALAKRYRLGCALRSEQYTQAIVLTNTFKSALVPFWARIPIRTGWHGEMRWGLLNDRRRLDPQALPSMIQRFCGLGLAKGKLLPEVLPWPELDHEAKVKNHKPRLILCPGAEYGPAKRWPAAYYADVAQARLKTGWEVYLVGSKGEQWVTQEIQAATGGRCVDMAGKTSLLEAIDLLATADAVVSNDSGLMHIAAALGRPLVAIYGSTDPRFTPPLGERVSIVSLHLACSPCFRRVCPLEHLRCLRDLMPARVLMALDGLHA